MLDGSVPEASVCVSYARADAEFVAELRAAFRNRIATRGDWDFETGEKWREAYRALLLDADALIFVVSPNSLNSEECGRELREAHLLRKKVLLAWLDGDIAALTLGESLGEFQWADFRTRDRYSDSFEKLIRGVQIDLALWAAGKRLQGRAEHWHRNRKDYLRGIALKEAQDWIGLTATRKGRLPQATPEIVEFVSESQRARARFLALSLSGTIAIGATLVVAVIVALIMRSKAVKNEEEAILALFRERVALKERENARLAASIARDEEERQRRVAEEREKEATARLLSAQSQAALKDSPRRAPAAVEQAAAALARHDSLETRTDLSEAVRLMPAAVKAWTIERYRISSEFAFDETGKRAALLRHDELELHDLESGSIKRTPYAFHGRMRFHPSQSLLAVCCSEATLALFDIASFTPQVSFPVTSGTHDVLFGAGGRIVAGSSGLDGVFVFDLARADHKPILRLEKSRAAALHPSSEQIAAVLDDNSFCVWDLNIAKCGLSLEKQPYLVKAVQYSRDGEMITVGDLIGVVRAYSARTGRRTMQRPTCNGPVQQIHPTGDPRNFIVHCSNGLAQLIRINLGENSPGFELPRFGNDDESSLIAVSPDDRYIAVAAGNGTQVYELRTGALCQVLLSKFRVSKLAFGVDGKSVFTAGEGAIQRFQLSIREHRPWQTMWTGGLNTSRPASLAS